MPRAVLVVLVLAAVCSAARVPPKINAGSLVAAETFTSPFESSQCINSTAKINCNPASHGTLTYLQVCPCLVEPCAFPPGGNITVSVGFIAGEPATSLTGSVHALLGPSKIIFPLANSNGCTPTGGDVACPLIPGHSYVYTTQLTVPTYAPAGVSVLVEWELLDQNSQDVWCLEVPVKTV